MGVELLDQVPVQEFVQQPLRFGQRNVGQCGGGVRVEVGARVEAEEAEHTLAFGRDVRV